MHTGAGPSLVGGQGGQTERSRRAFKMMLPLLLLGSFAMSIAAPSSCNLDIVAIAGGEYTVSEEGERINYKCPTGKYPYPAATRECQRNGQWTNEKQKAVCKVVECPKPVGPFEGGDYAPRKGKYFVGDVLHFECWGGFRLFGPENRTCQVNGKWSGETTICDDQEGYCPNPGIPIGATKDGSSYRVEGKVTYDCQNGLMMFGSKTRECQENKKWSGTEPSCRFYYTFDTPDEVSKGFSSSLAEILESSDPDREEVKTDRKLQVTAGGPMNIFIIIDASKSVGPDNFKTAKEIAEIFIDKISLYEFTPRYSVLTYASDIKRIVSLSDANINTDASKVIEEIQNFKYEEHDDKQGTNTRGALQEVYNQLVFDDQNNPGKTLEYSNIIILMTDGKHNMGGDPTVEVKRIREFLGIRKDNREDKLDIYAFGLGTDVIQDEINDISSKKDGEKHVFLLKSVDELKEAFDDIIDESKAYEMCGISKDHSKDLKEQFPWIAKIIVTRSTGEETCKGSIISPNFILTAAHCFLLDDQLHKINVQVGGITQNPKNLYRHPKYNPGGKTDKNVKKSFDYDLMLLELSQKLKFSSVVRPICLPCTVGASWALKQRDKDVTCKKHEDTLLSKDLVKALFITEKDREYKQLDVLIKQDNKRLDCLDDARKVEAFKDVADIRDMVTDNFLCTGGVIPFVDPQTCKGDSGGPLIIKYNKRFIQVGVISWGTVLSCEGFQRESPVPANSRDFHARLEMSWIEEVVKEDLIYVK